MVKLLRKFWWKVLRILGLDKKVYRLSIVDDIPDDIEKFTLYLVKTSGFDHLAVFHCPCECGDSIILNLLGDESPSWALIISGKDLPSLTPSVFRQTGCRSHFFMRNGEIEWT